jgi:hypothetical protein
MDQQAKEKLIYSCCTQFPHNKLTILEVALFTKLGPEEVERLMDGLRTSGRLPLQYLTHIHN